MKKVLHIQFYFDEPTTLIEQMAVLTAKHNAGKATIDLITLQGYFNAYCARYDWGGEANIIEDTLCLKMNDKPFINITEHLLIASIDENNIVSKNENY